MINLTKIRVSVALFLLAFNLWPLTLKAAFIDVEGDSSSYQMLQDLKTLDVVSGYADDTFRPDLQVSRAEAVKMIMKISAKPPVSGEITTAFSDVPADSWFAGYAMQAKDLGIIEGNADGTFAPNANVNKAAFIKMLIKAFNEDVSNMAYDKWQQNIGVDIGWTDWFYPYFAFAKEQGLLYSNLNNQMEPSHSMSREECADLIYKYYILKNGASPEKLQQIITNNLDDVSEELIEPHFQGAFEDANNATFFAKMALSMQPQSHSAQAKYILAQAYQQLVRAYQAKSSNNLEMAKDYSDQAGKFANESIDLNADLHGYVDEIRQLSAKM